MNDAGVNICEICNERFRMTFRHEEEEWVFDDCKEVNGVVYHYPLCYEVATEDAAKRS